MASFKKIGIVFILVSGVLSCNKTPDITPDMLDGTVLIDSSLLFPEKYLVSYSNPTPTSTEASKPVFLTAHGYSGSTFEWNEFRSWSSGTDQYFISQVLLGGHGRTYNDFKAASWHDWQSSIKEEYERLLAAGYTNINLVGSSTSCTLMLEMVASGYFSDKLPPANILLVDPIVIPSSKILSLIGVLGPVLGYVDSGLNPDEKPYWYSYRPEETLRQLQDIINVVRKDLEKGVVLPANTRVKVYKSKKDPTADPVSAVLIYKGLETYSGNKIELEMVDSELHVYTRLKLREKVTDKDVANQTATFEDFVARANPQVVHN